MATGTTSGIGAIAASRTRGKKFLIKLNFGTASIDVEEQMPSGDWIKIETAITADASLSYEGASATVLQLNVTAHTSAVEWQIEGA